VPSAVEITHRAAAKIASRRHAAVIERSDVRVRSTRGRATTRASNASARDRRQKVESREFDGVVSSAIAREAKRELGEIVTFT